jgi:hypothetical protein
VYRAERQLVTKLRLSILSSISKILSTQHLTLAKKWYSKISISDLLASSKKYLEANILLFSDVYQNYSDQRIQSKELKLAFPTPNNTHILTEPNVNDKINKGLTFKRASEIQARVLRSRPVLGCGGRYKSSLLIASLRPIGLPCHLGIAAYLYKCTACRNVTEHALTNVAP